MAVAPDCAARIRSLSVFTPRNLKKFRMKNQKIEYEHNMKKKAICKTR